MSTDIATITEADYRNITHPPLSTTNTAAQADNAATALLMQWAEGLVAAHRLGDALCRTSFVPRELRGKPEECAAVIMSGAEVGMSPMASLSNIFIFNGRPGMYARTMVAIVQSKGHEVWTVESSATKVVVAGRRKGSSETPASEWTIEDARKAGYAAKNPNYDKIPEDMLYARAASTICRRIASDALLGMPYTVEEMQDMEPETKTTITRRSSPAPTTTKVSRRAKAKSSDEIPEPDVANEQAPTTSPDEAREETTDQISEAQRKRMFAGFADLLGSDARTNEGKAERLAYIAAVVGREIESTNDLTATEAGYVIDAIEDSLVDPDTGELAYEGGE